jgi:hypothetical protein
MENNNQNWLHKEEQRNLDLMAGEHDEDKEEKEEPDMSGASEGDR